MRLLTSVAILVTFTSLALGQPRNDELFTDPRPPHPDVLDRLNLTQQWAKFVPTDGRRDGVLSVQMAPVGQGKDQRVQMLVQTRSGLVMAMDPETGETAWRIRVGEPYKGRFPLGFNDQYVVAERSTRIYGISRRTGELRWQLDMTNVISAAPLLDSRYLYLDRGTDSVGQFDLPAGAETRPTLRASSPSGIPLQLDPAITEGFLVYPSPVGSVLILSKDPFGAFLTVRTEGKLFVPPGVHEADSGVYIGSQDAKVYGTPLLGNEPSWRFAAGGPIIRRPFVNDDDVYAVAFGKGLFRLRRSTLTGRQLIGYLGQSGFVDRVQLELLSTELGEKANNTGNVISNLQRKGLLDDLQIDQLRFRGGDEVWRSPRAFDVLSVNPKFVYASDFSGRLLVLDRERGRELSSFNCRDFAFPIHNEINDRLYLAANNGLIVCLHDRDYPSPVSMKRLMQAPTQAAPAKPATVGMAKP